MSDIFANILNKPADAVEKPKPMPVGTYLCLVASLPEYKTIKTKNGEASKIHYKLKPLMADDDVDQEALAAAGGLGGYFPEIQFYLGVNEEEAEKNLWRVKEFVKNCGNEAEGVSIRQMLESAINCQVRVKIGHRPSDDGQQLFAEVKSTSKA